MQRAIPQFQYLLAGTESVARRMAPWATVIVVADGMFAAFATVAAYRHWKQIRSGAPR